jgi:hypothetical protein
MAKSSAVILSSQFTLAANIGSHDMAAPKSPALSGHLSGHKRQYPELPEDADEQQTRHWLKAVLDVSSMAPVGFWAKQRFKPARVGIKFISFAMILGFKRAPACTEVAYILCRASASCQLSCSGHSTGSTANLLLLLSLQESFYRDCEERLTQSQERPDAEVLLSFESAAEMAAALGITTSVAIKIFNRLGESKRRRLVRNGFA